MERHGCLCDGERVSGGSARKSLKGWRPVRSPSRLFSGEVSDKRGEKEGLGLDVPESKAGRIAAESDVRN